MDKNINGLEINKPANVTDAYDGGLKVIRDARNTSGGTPGHVNTTLYSYTLTGKDSKQFEWSGLFVVDNYSDAGENTALYSQINKYGIGPCYASVSEVCCLNPNDTGAQVGKEIDVWTAGKDSGYRVGLDVLVGDANLIRGKPKQAVVEATVGIRVGQNMSSPHAKWKTAIELNGNMDKGLDVSKAKCVEVITLNANQVIRIGDTIISASGISKVGATTPIAATQPAPVQVVVPAKPVTTVPSSPFAVGGSKPAVPAPAPVSTKPVTPTKSIWDLFKR